MKKKIKTRNYTTKIYDPNQSTRMKKKIKTQNYTTYLDVVGMGWICPIPAYWLNVSQSSQLGGDVEQHHRHLDS